MDRVNYEQRVLDSLDKLEEDVTEIKVELAAQPAKYVTKEEAQAEKDRASVTRRWAISAFVAAATAIVAVINTI